MSYAHFKMIKKKNILRLLAMTKTLNMHFFFSLG